MPVMKWVREPRVMKLSGNCLQNMFVDNYSGHNLNAQILEAGKK